MPQLAEKFFTSVARLLNDNPDFVDRAGGYDKAVGRALVPGYNLCILPPLCQVASSISAHFFDCGRGFSCACARALPALMHARTKDCSVKGAQNAPMLVCRWTRAEG